MSEAQLIITLVAPPVPDAVENYWIRLRQVGADGDFATVADAAAVVDAAFQIDPCSPQTGGQEVEYNEDGTYAAAVQEDEFAAVVKAAIDYDVCAAEDPFDWTATVEVIRSHNAVPYNLVIDGGAVLQTVVVSERKTVALLFDNEHSKDLDYPIISGLSVGWAGTVVTKSGTLPKIKILGSTVNLSEAATGSLSLQYLTEYDLATIQIPGNGEQSLQSAEVLAFYHYLVEPATLSPPDVDPADTDATTLCNRNGTIDIPDKETQCWETVLQVVMCECGTSEASSETVTVAVTCPDGYQPGDHMMGTRRQIIGYADCGDEGSDLDDPEFYQERCCTPPPFPLPKCLVRTAMMGGGVGIVNGPQYYIDTYGPGTRMVGVAPKDGNCGTVTWKQQVNALNCCEDIEDIIPDPTNPSSIEGGGRVRLCVEGGAGILTWKAGGGLYFDNGDNELVTVDRCAYVNAPPVLCPDPMVRVNDQCSRASITLTNSSAPDPLSLSLTITASAEVLVGGVELLIEGGVADYILTSTGMGTYFDNGKRSITLSGNGLVYLHVNHEQVCLGGFTVTVSDACATIDSISVDVPAVGTVCIKYWTFYSSLADWGAFSPYIVAPVVAPEMYRKWWSYTGITWEAEVIASWFPPSGFFFTLFGYVPKLMIVKENVIQRYSLDGAVVAMNPCPGDQCAS